MVHQSSDDGYFYRDLQGTTQGPLTNDEFSRAKDRGLIKPGFKVEAEEWIRIYHKRASSLLGWKDFLGDKLRVLYGAYLDNNFNADDHLYLHAPKNAERNGRK